MQRSSVVQRSRFVHNQAFFACPHRRGVGTCQGPSRDGRTGGRELEHQGFSRLGRGHCVVHGGRPGDGDRRAAAAGLPDPQHRGARGASLGCRREEVARLAVGCTAGYHVSGGICILFHAAGCSP